MSNTEISYYIVQLADYFELLPIGLFLWFRTSRKEHHWLFLYSVVLFFFYLVADYIGLSKTNNLWVYHLIGLSEVVILTLYYKSFFQLSKLILVLLFLTITIYILDSTLINGIVSMNSIGRSISTLYLLGLNFYFYFDLYNRENVVNLNYYLPFWFNAALTFYLSASFFVFLLSNEILTDAIDITEYFYDGWTLHSFGIIVKNLITGIALIKLGKR